MKEVEVKILEIDRKAVVKQLRELGAKKVFSGELDAIYWDYKDKSLRAQKKTFRLRKEGDQTVLTFKTRVKHTHVKINREDEVRISDFETMIDILRSLGLTTNLHTRKKRTTYKMDGLKFEIDQYTHELSHIPCFLEIEAQDYDAIKQVIKKLGYSLDDCVPYSTNDLIKHYRHLKPA